jgi:hypothetical protein
MNDMMTLKNVLLASLTMGGIMPANQTLQGQARVPAYVITEILYYGLDGWQH